MRVCACAGCSNPNLPIGGSTTGLVPAGTFQVSAALLYTGLRVIHESACPDIGPVCLSRNEAPNLHDQSIWIGELRAAVEYGVNDWLGVRLQVPVKLLATTITYRHLDGTAFEPDWVGIHHRDETLFGIGDPWLTARIGTNFQGFTLLARVGASLPLGRTEADPFLAGREGREHQHIQFGTGTFNPLLAGEVLKPLGDVLVGGYFQAMPVLVENAQGFRAGHRFSTGMFGGTLFFEKLRASLAVDVVHEEAERWGGIVQQDGNLGRTDVLAGATVSYPFGNQQFSLGFRTPVFQRVIGGQVSYPAIVTLAVDSEPFGPGA